MYLLSFLIFFYFVSCECYEFDLLNESKDAVFPQNLLYLHVSVNLFTTITITSLTSIRVRKRLGLDAKPSGLSTTSSVINK